MKARAAISWMCFGLTVGASAQLIQFRVENLSGTIDPITYTDPDGTFTTSVISLSLDASMKSVVSINKTTGFVQATTAFLLSFDNGKTGGTFQSFVGKMVVDESGFLGSDPDAGVDLDINGGTLTTAGPFSGAKLKGKNPTFFQGSLIKWKFGRPTNRPTVELSPPFDPTPIELTGEANAQLVPVPEPGTIVGGAVLALFCARMLLRRRTPHAGGMALANGVT